MKLPVLLASIAILSSCATPYDAKIDNTSVDLQASTIGYFDFLEMATAPSCLYASKESLAFWGKTHVALALIEARARAYSKSNSTELMTRAKNSFDSFEDLLKANGPEGKPSTTCIQKDVLSAERRTLLDVTSRMVTLGTVLSRGAKK